MNSERFGLTSKDWKFLEKELINPLKAKGAKVWIFGSRALGTHQKFSDIDILFEVDAELPPHFIVKLKEKIEESRFPIKLDLVDRRALASSYERNILEQLKEV